VTAGVRERTAGPWKGAARVTVWRSAPNAIVAWAADVDPARAALEVFHEQEFWWKRLEPRSVSTSWLASLLAPVWAFLGRVLAPVWALLGRVLQYVGEWLAKLLRAIFGDFHGGFAGGTLAVWLIVVAVLAWSAWKLYPAIARWLGGGGPPAPGAPTGVSWQTLAEAADLLEQAGQAFRAGMHAEAIRLALLALIARLEKDGLLRYDTTRTNREYQMELRHRSELAACFGQLARIYERTWYGRMSAGRAEAEEAIRLCGAAINREGLAPE
jgi:hypothetical protein